MAETSVRRESSGGDRRNRAKRSRPPPPPPMSPRDLITAMPDAVIHHIFSFLPLRDVVKTGALSKRWRSTWTTTTHLVFDDAGYSWDFPSLVHSVLFRCTSPAVKRFHIINFRKSRDLFKVLLEKLRGVSTITIGGWCSQVLSALEMEGASSPLSKCQNLILRAPVSQCELPGIAYMLRSSQCLEKLVIHLTRTVYEVLFQLDEEPIQRFNFDGDLLCSWKGNFQCLVKHLKRVEIIDFAYAFESKHLLALVQFLVGNALALEKMIIKADLHELRGQKRLCKLLGVSRNVLSYQRASQNAEVIFDYPLEEVSFEAFEEDLGF
ncbi:hypothetical protein NL676_030296 [Syzygium grande]|nr:hypothetical protein NL676_030296 [Syzygium grande]